MPKTILLAEAHFDPIAREMVLNNLDFFLRAGYKHFAFEHDHGQSIAFEIDALKKHLDNMQTIMSLFMRGVVPSSELSKDLIFPLLMCPSNAVLYQLLLAVQTNNMHYFGIDKPLLGNRFKHTATSIHQQSVGQTDNRSDYMAEKLLEHVGEGVIAIVGADHLERIQRKLIDKLGLEEAQAQFSVIVPFVLLEDSQIDIRSKWLDLAASRNIAPLQVAFPLRQINFFGGQPATFTEQCQSTDDRFQQFVRTRCWGQTVNNELSCAGYVFGYLYRLFSGNGSSLATRQYLQIGNQLKKYS